LNTYLLEKDVQDYISSHIAADIHRIAMTKSPFEKVSSAELATQLAAKQKSRKKLPSWYHTKGIYYPLPLSIEQSSSEIAAAYKATLTKGKRLIDLTGGFGVDSLYFAKQGLDVTHCELNQELSAIAAHNAAILGQPDIRFISGNGLTWLERTENQYDTIYIDPVRRNLTGKVFMLKDCTPNVADHLDLMLRRSGRIMIKTAPLLDLSAGLKELRKVSAIHIVSIRNECKELLWIIDSTQPDITSPDIVAVALNERQKTFSFNLNEAEQASATFAEQLGTYLYEPDAALLKSGAFDLISVRYSLQKLQQQTHLYTSNNIDATFPGRIFKISEVIRTSELKRQKQLIGNVIVRNYPERAEILARKYKIKPDQQKFLIFTQSIQGKIIIQAEIRQYY